MIDPRLSETAALADFHLQIRPGTDAWCLAALVGIIVQDGMLARDWLAEHTSGYEHIVDELNAIPVAYCAETCGVAEDKLRAAARRIASASSVSALEDLGMQMNLHSTLGSYLQRLVWLLTGHYGRPGTSNAFVPFLSLSKASKGDTSMGKKGAPRVEAQPGGQCQDHHRPDSLQRDSRGNPHRPSQALSRHAGGDRQPAAFAGR